MGGDMPDFDSPSFGIVACFFQTRAAIPADDVSRNTGRLFRGREEVEEIVGSIR